MTTENRILSDEAIQAARDTADHSEKYPQSRAIARAQDHASVTPIIEWLYGLSSRYHHIAHNQNFRRGMKRLTDGLPPLPD